jgi:hypothetical protein
LFFIAQIDFDSVQAVKKDDGHTTGMLDFSGVKGNPIGGFLFNHVASSKA